MSRRQRLAAAALLLLCALALGIALLRAGVYGYTVFTVLPLFAGATMSWAFKPSTAGRAAGIGALTGLAACCCFLVLGLEGIVCVVMAAPLVIPLGVLGALFMYRIGATEPRRARAAILLPASLLFDVAARPPLYSVSTGLTINAPPERVWPLVVAFPPIPAPAELAFRAGIAFPLQTRSAAPGAGSARFCDLSTGTMPERVTVWSPPRLLRFSVASTPPSMRETGLYGPVDARHLTGYFTSVEGQFALAPLPGNRTRLTGTSWYRHGLWPAEYWRWWSDAIVHSVHTRVLNHIRRLAEQPGA